MIFKVTINGMIKGIKHRFHGGSGTPEYYEVPADSSREIAILRECPYTFEVDAAPAPEPEPEPDAPEIIDARARLGKMSMKALAGGVKNRRVMKPGMNKAALIEALLKRPEVISELLQE